MLRFFYLLSFGMLLCFPQINSEGSFAEQFYQYSSEIELTNSDHLKPPISKFWLRGILSVNIVEETKIIQIMNFESSNCNGVCPAFAGNDSSVENALFKPFALMKDDKKHVMFSENEPIWSRNMKRGIAHILEQAEIPIKLSPELENSFQTEYSHKISKSDDDQSILSVAESRGKYMHVGLENRGIDLRTRQKLELISTKILNEDKNSMKKRNATQKMTKHAMEFEIPKYVSRIVDYERFDNNSTHLINLIQNKIDEVIGYLKNDNFFMNSSSLQRSKSLRGLLSLIKHVDLNGFRQLYSKLHNKERRSILLSFLSYTDTDASMLFMCQLYHNGMLESQMYNKYLIEIPFTFKNATEKFLKAWLTCHQSAIASKQNIKNTDQTDRAFFLAFSIVFNKVYKYQLENSTVIPEYSTHNRKSFFLKFIRNLCAEFENSKTIQQKLNTLDVLKNALAGSMMLLNYLNDTVINNKSMATEVRLNACRLTMNWKYNEKSFMVFSPILMDETEPLVLRAAALDVIIQHLNGTLHLLQPCIKHFRSSSYLYNYFYSYIEQISRSSNPQNENLRTWIADYMEAPLKQFSTSFLRIYSLQGDDYSQQNNFSEKSTLFSGRELLIKYIAEPVTSFPHLLHIQLNSYHTEDVRNDFSIYIELKGVSKYFLANVLRNINETIPMDAIPELLKQYNESKMEGNVEIVVEKYGYLMKRVSHRLTNAKDNSSLVEKVWELLSLGNLDFDELFCRSDSVLKETSKLFKCERNSVHKSVCLLFNEKENVFVTDNGFTVMHSYFTPYFYHIIRNESVKDSGLNFAFFTRFWQAEESEFSIYNPFLESWTGVTKLQTTQVQIPIEIEDFKMTDKQIRGILINTNDSLKNFLLEMRTDAYNFTENYGSDNTDVNYESIIEEVQQFSFDISESILSNLSNFTQSTVKHEFKNIVLEMSESGNEQNCGSLINTLLRFTDPYLGHSVPRICNFKLMSNPSELSTKISVDLKVYGRYTDKHPLSGKQLSIEGNVSLIGDDTLRSTVRSYTFITNFTSTSNDVTTQINTRLKYYTGGVPDGDEYLVTFSKQFPAVGSDVFAYGWDDETVHTRLQISCASADRCMQLRFHIIGQISDEQKELAHGDNYPYSRCRLEQKLPVWRGPLLPRTWACYEAAVRLFYTRNVTLGAQYRNVPKTVEDLAVKAFHSFNSFLPKHLLENADGSQKTGDGEIQLSILHNATAPTFDVNMSLPIGSFHYKDVPGIDKDIYNIELDSTHFSKAIQFMESTAIVRSCIANGDSVLTPDNTTVQHTFNSSYDLLTTTFDRKFAVLAKRTPDGMAVKVLIGNLSLEITPNDTELNGHVIENLENGFEFPKGDPYYMFRIWKNRGQVTVYSKVLLFYLIHSPVSITLDMPVIYLGQVEGLCGNLD